MQPEAFTGSPAHKRCKKRVCFLVNSVWCAAGAQGAVGARALRASRKIVGVFPVRLADFLEKTHHDQCDTARTTHSAPSGKPINSAATRAAATSSLKRRLIGTQPPHNRGAADPRELGHTIALRGAAAAPCTRSVLPLHATRMQLERTRLRELCSRRRDRTSTVFRK